MHMLYAIVDTLLPFEWLEMTFMKNGLFALLLISPLLAILGTMAVNQRMAFFSDALGHSALTGIALGMMLSLSSDLLSMLLFGVFWALLITRIKFTETASADTVISVFSSTSVAMVLMILARGGGFARFSSLLIGDVLAATPQALGQAAIALVAGLIIWAMLYNALFLSAINASLAASRGIRVRLISYVFVVLVAVAVMLSIHLIGVLLINALLIIPAAAGRNIAKSARGHTVASAVIALISAVFGLMLCYYLDTSAGAGVVICSAGCYFVTLGVRALKMRTGFGGGKT